MSKEKQKAAVENYWCRIRNYELIVVFETCGLSSATVDDRYIYEKKSLQSTTIITCRSQISQCDIIE